MSKRDVIDFLKDGPRYEREIGNRANAAVLRRMVRDGILENYRVPYPNGGMGYVVMYCIKGDKRQHEPIKPYAPETAIGIHRINSVKRDKRGRLQLP